MRVHAGFDVGRTTDFAPPADERRLFSPARTRLEWPAAPETEANESVTRRASGAV